MLKHLEVHLYHVWNFPCPIILGRGWGGGAGAEGRHRCESSLWETQGGYWALLVCVCVCV